MKKNLLLTICLFVMGINISLAQQNCVEIQKIWDNGTHSAFTSIIEFNGKYYCAFREGYSHIFDDKGEAEGKIRIIASDDGENWISVALIQKPKYDLRDAKLSVMPDGRMMVLMGGSVYVDKKLVNQFPQVSFTQDGVNYSEPVPLTIDKKVETGRNWIWRVIWDGNTGYGVDYNNNGLFLMKTGDGIAYELVAKLEIPDFPNEATVRMLPDKTMLMMVRRDSGDCKGYWGTSSPPYTDWNWKIMDFRLGGPDFILLNDDLLVAGTRSHFIPSAPKTIILTGNKKGVFQEKYILPSGGDTSYPGFLIVGNQLWVSYYSSHETPKASIYLAKFPLSFFKE